MQKTILDCIKLLKTQYSNYNLDDFFLPIKLGARYFLAVSGGVDSMVMATLAIFFLIKKEIPKTDIIILHYNHHQREESQAEEDGIQEFFQGFQVTVGLYEAKKIASENILRKARWRFFEEQLQKHSDSMLYVGHHFEDRLETMMLNMKRGSGIRGIQDVMPNCKKVVKYDGRNYTVSRPLSSFLKQEIYSIAHKLHIPYWEDSSNVDPAVSQRNTMRQLLGILHEDEKSFFSCKDIDTELHCIKHLTVLAPFGEIVYRARIPSIFLRTVEDCMMVLDYVDIYSNISTARLDEIVKVLTNTTGGHIYCAGRYLWKQGKNIFIIKAPRHFWQKSLDFVQEDTRISLGGWMYEGDFKRQQRRSIQSGDHRKGKSLTSYLNTRGIPLFLKPYCIVCIEDNHICDVLAPHF